MKKLLDGRFRTLYVIALIIFISSFITRFTLLFYSHSSVSFNLIDLFKSFLTGTFFDLVTFSYFMLPYLLFIIIIPPVIARTKIYKGLVWFFFSLTIFILVFNAFAEFFFWDEFEVRFNFIAVDYLVYTNEVIGNIVESYSLPLLISMVGIIAGIIIWKLVKNKTVSTALKSNESFIIRLKKASLLLIITAFSWFFVTLSWSQISNNSYNNELAKNGIYSLFEAFKNNQLDYDRFYKTIDDKDAFTELRILMKDSAYSYPDADVMHPIYKVKKSGEERRMNVMFVCVESLSGEYMKYIKEPDEYDMPFMDSLSNKAVFFSNMYANGTRTVRGLEALNLSIPPTPGTSIVRRANNDHLFSLGEIFKSKGYDNKFLYGGYGYFDNMNTFFSGNGFEIVDRDILSKEEITFANAWGACDQDMYRRAIKEADKSVASGKPFLNFIMTTSNHRPYTFPDVGIPLTANRTGGVRYTDFALEWFFKEAKNKSWFNNTIFVIVADHCGSSAGKTEIPVLKYQIPCIIYAPTLMDSRKVDKLCSQVDVVPTLLSMLNWSYSSTFYGKDIFTMTPSDERAFVGTYQKLGYIKGNTLSVLSPQKKLTQYNFDRYSGEMKAQNISPQMEKEIVSLYQTAEHMFMKGMNRVDKVK